MLLLEKTQITELIGNYFFLITKYDNKSKEYLFSVF